MPRINARKTMLAKRNKPRKLPTVHTVYHGTTAHPAKVKRQGLKPKGQAYTGPYKKTSRAIFASHDKGHASSFGSTRPRQKAYVYSMKKKGPWHSEPYKSFVDSQYSRQRQRPVRVQQVVRTKSNTMKYGHSWNVKTGSLPKHTSTQQRPRRPKI